MEAVLQERPHHAGGSCGTLSGVLAIIAFFFGDYRWLLARC